MSLWGFASLCNVIICSENWRITQNEGSNGVVVILSDIILAQDVGVHIIRISCLIIISKMQLLRHTHSQAGKDATNSKPWFRRAPVTHSFKFGRLISCSVPFTCFQYINMTKSISKNHNNSFQQYKKIELEKREDSLHST